MNWESRNNGLYAVIRKRWYPAGCTWVRLWICQKARVLLVVQKSKAISLGANTCVAPFRKWIFRHPPSTLLAARTFAHPNSSFFFIIFTSLFTGPIPNATSTSLLTARMLAALSWNCVQMVRFFYIGPCTCKTGKTRINLHTLNLIIHIISGTKDCREL